MAEAAARPACGRSSSPSPRAPRSWPDTRPAPARSVSRARASILALASARHCRRSARRASSSGIDIPSGTSAVSAASASAISSSTSAFNCASIFPACSYDSALCRLALACTLVPSSATVPSFTMPALPGQHQKLHKQTFDLRQKAPPETWRWCHGRDGRWRQ